MKNLLNDNRAVRKYNMEVEELSSVVTREVAEKLFEYLKEV